MDNNLYKAYVTSIDIDNHRAQVRIPQFHGGINDPTRIVDSKLPYAMSTVQLINPTDIGKVVYVMFEGGNTNRPVIIGRLIYDFIQLEEMNNGDN